MKRLLVATVVVFLILSAGSVCAQMLNYQPFQLGVRPSMLGGAAVAGVRESSAIFYNPAALSFVPETNLGVSAQLVRYSSVTVEGALGSGEDFTDDGLDFLGNLFSVGWSPSDKWSFAFGVAQRSDYGRDFRGSVDRPVGLIPDADFAADFQNDSEGREVWCIGAASYRINEELSVGVAPIISYRNYNVVQRRASVLSSSETLPSFNLSTTSQLFEAKFWQISLLARLALAWEPTPWLKLGCTFTTPGVSLFGSGEELAMATRSSDLDDQPDISARNAQEGLGTDYRIPLSATAGAEFQFREDWRFAISLEFHNGVDRAVVVDVDTNNGFFRDDPAIVLNGTQFMQIIDDRDPVVNVNVGVEYRISDKYSTYLGFWTDFSPVDLDTVRALSEPSGTYPREGFPMTPESIDFYNFSLGATRRKGSTLIGVSIIPSFGTGSMIANVDYVNDVVPGPGGDPQFPIFSGGQLDNGVERKVTTFGVSMLFSFTHYF
jgi:long-subunit fatty acid transport protein